MKKMTTILSLMVISFTLFAQPSHADGKSSTASYCMFDLYGTWSAWLTSSEAVCSSGIGVSSSGDFATQKAAENSLELAVKALSNEGYKVIENFELAPDQSIYWHMFRLFKKNGEPASKSVCAVFSSNGKILGCTRDAMVSISALSNKLSEENLRENGFVQTGFIKGKNIYKNQTIKIFEK